MPMVIIGLLLGGAWLAGIEPVASLDWWWLLLPFAAAVAWWSFADSTGVTQRRAMQKMEDRKAERRERAMVNLGLDTRRKGLVDKAQAQAQRHAKTMSGSTSKPAQPPSSAPSAPTEPKL